jgi:hypothetical protein
MDQCGVVGAFGFAARLIQKINIRVLLVMAALVAAPAVAFAQTDEIQVYDGAIAEKGIFNLTLHNNFTPSGLKDPAFPGAIVPDRALNGVPEWAYGVTDWFEMGLYMPLYSISKGRGASLNGFKLRTLFARPHADDHTFVYGMNFEFSYNAKYWDTKRATAEIRPIVGFHLHPVDIIVNPILDTSYNGIKNLDFAPATRLSYNLSSTWVLSAEEYSDYGPLRQFYSTNDQFHQLFAVVDRSSKRINVQFGVGFGLTPASDKVTLKLILSRDLNSKVMPSVGKEN